MILKTVVSSTLNKYNTSEDLCIILFSNKTSLDNIIY